MKILKDINNRQYLILLFIIVAVGAGLRIYNLGTESYWYDEFVMIRVAGNDFTYIYDQFINGRPPVYVIFAHFWIEWFGTSETATRSLSAIFGILSIPMMYLVGKQLFNRKLGILSAFLISISQFQIYYSQEFRYYSLFLFFTLSSYYFYIKFINQKKYTDLILCSIFNILLFYTHYYGLFIIIAQFIFILIKYRRFKSVLYSWLMSQIIVIIFMLPIIYINFIKNVVNAQDSGQKWLINSSPIAETFIYIYKFIASGIPWDAIWDNGVYPVPTMTSLLIGIIYSIGSIFIYNKFRKKKMNISKSELFYNPSLSKYKNELKILCLWLFCPIVCALTLTYLIGTKYPIRYLIGASPAFYLILSFLIIRIEKFIPVFVTTGFIIILIAPGLADYYSHDVKVQWRETVTYVERSTTDEEVLIIPDWNCPQNENDKKLHGSDANKKDFNFYYRGELRSCCMNIWNIWISKSEFDSELNNCISGVGSFWLVLDDIVDYDDNYLMIFLNNKNLTNTISQRFYQVRAYSFKIIKNGSN